MATRNNYIVDQRAQGRTYASIGREFSLSTSRIREICIRAARKHQFAQQENPFEGTIIQDWPTVALSTRARNCLVNMVGHRENSPGGVMTVDELRALLGMSIYRASKQLRNCGRKTRQELRVWLENITTS